jgi:hypothetical protein
VVAARPLTAARRPDDWLGCLDGDRREQTRAGGHSPGDRPCDRRGPKARPRDRGELGSMISN